MSGDSTTLIRFWADSILATLELNLERFLQAVQRGCEHLLERSCTESALTPSAR